MSRCALLLMFGCLSAAAALEPAAYSQCRKRNDCEKLTGVKGCNSCISSKSVASTASHSLPGKWSCCSSSSGCSDGYGLHDGTCVKCRAGTFSPGGDLPCSSCQCGTPTAENICTPPTCDSATGKCGTLMADGRSCGDDGEPGAVCKAGVCVNAPGYGGDAYQPCRDGFFSKGGSLDECTPCACLSTPPCAQRVKATCDAATGRCSRLKSRPNGEGCMLKAKAGVCQSGNCVAGKVDCPTDPGQSRADCFCEGVRVFKYYADTLNGCIGAMQCSGPGQAAYITCPGGQLFNGNTQTCDWAYNVPCGGAAASPKPVTLTPSCTVYSSAGGVCGPNNGGKCCPSGQCCSQWGNCGVTDSHCGAGCLAAYGSCSGSSSPSPPPPATSPSPSPVNPPSSPVPPPSPGGGSYIEQLVPKSTFETLFLHRNDAACTSKGFYTYENFIAAADAFPGFGTSSSDDAINLREIAAFFAQVSHETTGGWSTAPDGPYAWGLCWVTEGGATPPTASYCDSSNVKYPCAAGKKYYGRGPIQLSWNFNYGQCGTALGVDLLNNPDLVASDGLVTWKTAIWFWMTAQSPKPSCHDVMTNKWTPSSTDVSKGRLPGFGMTTNIINGGLECNTHTLDARVQDRIGFFKRYVGIMGTTTGDNLDCKDMASY